MYLKQGYRLHNDKYQLLNVLGEGGFSLTYRGILKTEVHGDLGKVPAFVPICIKEFFFKDYCLRNSITFFVETNSETGKEIFNKNKEKIIREARILSEIHHPNVVNVLEVFKQNNTVYIVMEFISGHSLKYEVEHKGIFTEEKLKKIIYKVGQALNYIHEKNILHLDIKPNNILIDQNGNPKLIDFGISKKYDLSNDQETSTALLAASKGYASIEQYDSEGIQVFSPRPDIYSLGATMYYLLTGQVPTESILRSTKGLQNPRELNPAISENTENVILKAMALNAADRYESVMEMLLDLGFDPDIDKIDLSSASLPEHPEITTEVSGEPYDFDADDETRIRTNEIYERKRQKNYNWLYFVIPSLVSGIMALVLFGGFWKKLPDNILVEPIQTTNPIDTVNNNQVLPSDIDTVSITLTPDPISNQVANQTVVPEDANEINYQKKLSEAMIAQSQNNFLHSNELIDQAELYKKTIETERIRAANQQKIEEIEIVNRKNNYEIRMDFGNFAVAKRKLDNKIGTINKKGFEEGIPFKYKNTSPTPHENYRLFQKESNLWDLYKSNGEVIKEDFNGIIKDGIIEE